MASFSRSLPSSGVSGKLIFAIPRGDFGLRDQDLQQHSNQLVVICATAVGGITMGNEEIRFRGRFGGVAIDILVPVAAVLGIYARENGQGMVFDPEPPDTPEPPGIDGHTPMTGVIVGKSLPQCGQAVVFTTGRGVGATERFGAIEQPCRV